ncbi:hypothetical protein [uncultured Roseobacter sp.]|uniref:hypothetical protein n=1 Tax=uncultured Roseobacter sp. TaxID=114847 RepID=UPI0026272606|nr:hypothetical protein [uncultured Roseobacter sp.]
MSSRYKKTEGMSLNRGLTLISIFKHKQLELENLAIFANCGSMQWFSKHPEMLVSRAWRQIFPSLFFLFSVVPSAALEVCDGIYGTYWSKTQSAYHHVSHCQRNADYSLGNVAVVPNGCSGFESIHTDCVSEAQNYCEIIRDRDAAVKECRARAALLKNDEDEDSIVDSDDYYAKRLNDQRGEDRATGISKKITDFALEGVSNASEGALDRLNEVQSDGWGGAAQSQFANPADLGKRIMQELTGDNDIQLGDDFENIWNRTANTLDQAGSDGTLSLDEAQRILDEGRRELDAQHQTRLDEAERQFDEAISRPTSQQLEERMRQLNSDIAAKQRALRSQQPRKSQRSSRRGDFCNLSGLYMLKCMDSIRNHNHCVQSYRGYKNRYCR